MHEQKSKLESLEKLIDQGLEKVDLPSKKVELKKLQAKTLDPNFWDDAEKARTVSQRVSNLEKLIETWTAVNNDCQLLLEMFPEIKIEEKPAEAAEYKQMVENLEVRWRKLEISTFLSGKYDENNAILSVHTGTGGTDAADFAEMLLRMYMRYAEKMEFKTELIERSNADEAGIKSASIMIKGQFAYGYLKGEGGVHRLVRLSPFNSKNTRETSFVQIEILPEIEQDNEVEIAADDLKIDVYRASGKGGQSVNTTDSAVRITHLPTGLVVQCQNERSQLQNKEHAMKVLKGKLADLMEKQQAAEISELKGDHKEMSWGNQIRSYVLHPYKMVKDHRSNYEEKNPDKVLDGELDGFIEAELKRVK
jgi:peptide chain release factor 2